MTAVLRGGERSRGMELERARTLLTELADGVDPLTGECLPSDSVCNRPEIIRALHCVLQHTAGGQKRPSPPNAGKPWTEADDSALLQMYDAGSDVGELKTHFQRSRTAIIPPRQGAARGAAAMKSTRLAAKAASRVL